MPIQNRTIREAIEDTANTLYALNTLYVAGNAVGDPDTPKLRRILDNLEQALRELYIVSGQPEKAKQVQTWG